MKKIINNKNLLLKACKGLLAAAVLIFSLVGNVPAPWGVFLMLNGCAPISAVGGYSNLNLDLFNAIHQKKNDYVYSHLSSYNVNTVRFVNNLPPLVWAIQAKNVEAAKYIIDIGADVNMAQNQNEHYAVNNSTVRQITPPLMAAMAHAVSDTNTWMPIVRLLIEKGANVNAKQYSYVNSPGNNTYVDAEFYPICTYSSNDDILKLLVDHGANVNAQCSSKSKDTSTYYTALHTAVQAGRLKSIQLLIDHGADINARNDKGKTALQLAEDKRDFVAVDMLKGTNGSDSKVVSNPKKPSPGSDTKIVSGTKKPSPQKRPVITILSPEIKRGLKLVAREPSISVTGTVDSVSNIVNVTVNGEEASLDEKGYFSAEVQLKTGENKITVTALGTDRQQTTESFAVDRKYVKAARTKPAVKTAAKTADTNNKTTVSAGNGKSYAFVIGINAYKHIEGLKTAVNDAKEIAMVLNQSYGFETKLLLDDQATRNSIISELNRLRKKLTPDDSLLVYYAGHGNYDRVTDTAYWLPVDAERDSTTNWIESKSITDELKRISSRHVLVVADSCYSGTLTRSINLDLTGNDTRDNYLRKLMEKASRVLIASGGNEPVADGGGKGKHSIFADAFIKALTNPQRDVFTAEELLTNHVKESVAGRSEQTPEYKVIRNSGHDGGDFIFLKKN